MVHRSHLAISALPIVSPLTRSPSANPDGTIDMQVSSDAVALFVTLTTLAQGA